MRTVPTLLLSLALLHAAHAAEPVSKPAQARDWPCWRGPQRTSYTPEALNVDWPKDGPKKLWSAKVGMGYSCLAIKGNRGYTSGGNQFVYCLDLETGREVWKTEIPMGKCQAYMGFGSFGTPVVEGNRVYQYGNRGMVLSLDAETGKIVWKRDLSAEGIAMCHYGYGGSPLLYKNLLILNNGFALKAESGETAWRNESITNPWYASPVLYEKDGKTAVLICCQPKNTNVIGSYDPETGKENWSYAFTKWPHSHLYAVADPIVLAGGDIFFSNSNSAARLKTEAASVTLAKSDYKYSNSFLGDPTHYNGYVYGFAYMNGDPPQQKDLDGAHLQCIDAVTGEVKWNQPKFSGTLSIAGDKLLIMTPQGELVAAAASPDGYKELARAQVFPNDMKGRNGAWVMPVLVNGRIYCRNLCAPNSEIVCLDPGAPAEK